MEMDSGSSPNSAKLPARRRLETEYYQDETKKPFVCLVFVLPILLAYEIGILFFQGEVSRNGVDAWLRQTLGLLGLGQYVLLPLLMTWTLLVWHRQRGEQWRIRPTVLGGMAIESMGLALILLCAANAHQRLFSDSLTLLNVVVGSVEIPIGTTIAYLGAGIYEEFFFRLVLLLPLVTVLNKAIGPRTMNTVIAVVLTSLLFAAVHYQIVNPAGTPFEWPGFLFRFLASIFFCILFLFRGFGIAVGAHAFYDVLTQI